LGRTTVWQASGGFGDWSPGIARITLLRSIIQLATKRGGRSVGFPAAELLLRIGPFA